MNRLDVLVAQPLGRALGQGLLESLWLITLLALLFGVAQLFLRRAAPGARYLLGCLTLLAMLGTTGLEVHRALGARKAVLSIATGESVLSELDLAAEQSGALPRSAPRWPRLGVWMAYVWILGVPLMSLRLALGWLGAHSLTRKGHRPLERRWREVGEDLSRRLGVKRVVRFLASTRISSPGTVGWLRPVVLVPSSLLSGLPPAQIEALLAHELAHVRRHDYLVKLIQSIIEVLLFYHPAVWWVSHRVQIEREHCCDDLAVDLSGDPIALVRALTKAEEHRAAVPRLALAATGGLLMGRIRRILGIRTDEGARTPGLLTAVVAGAGLATVLLGSLSSVAQPLPEEGQRSSLPGEVLDLQVELLERAELLTARGVDSALRHLTADDWISRAAAAWALGEIGATEAVAELIDALRDPETWVRKNAALSLGKLEDTRTVGPLLVALSDPESSVRERSADSLGEIGSTQAVPALIEALNDSDGEVREATARALGRLGDSRAVPALIETLWDTDSQVREWSARALGWLNDEIATEPLRMALQDPDDQVREAAMRALADMM